MICLIAHTIHTGIYFDVLGIALGIWFPPHQDTLMIKQTPHGIHLIDIMKVNCAIFLQDFA